MVTAASDKFVGDNPVSLGQGEFSLLAFTDINLDDLDLAGRVLGVDIVQTADQEVVVAIQLILLVKGSLNLLPGHGQNLQAVAKRLNGHGRPVSN